MLPTSSAPQPRVVRQEDLEPARPFYCEDLLFLQAANDRRRAAAMVVEHDTVAGLRLQPITPRSYSMLLALGSPFAYRQPGGAADVRNYVWLHCSRFTMDPTRSDSEREKALAALERNILPAWHRWRYSRRKQHDIRATGYAVAAARIAEILEETFADAPAPGRGGPAVGASLEAQFLEVFAQWPTWPLPTSVSSTPLRKLYQLLRAMNGGDFNNNEADLIAEELRRDNLPAMAARGGRKD